MVLNTIWQVCTNLCKFHMAVFAPARPSQTFLHAANRFLLTAGHVVIRFLLFRQASDRPVFKIDPALI